MRRSANKKAYRHGDQLVLPCADRGFTLLEILLAVALMAVTATITFMTFNAATTAWQRGTSMVDRLHHGDYVMQQVLVALRSAYFKQEGLHGFQHTSGGLGSSASDEISWVKLGGALVGREQDYVETPHRVRLFMGRDDNGREGIAFTGWRLAGQEDDFDPDALPPVVLSERVVGFACRTAWEFDAAGEIDWLDEWERTNNVPALVEVTLYLQPVSQGEPPLEMRRVAQIRLGEAEWRRP
jgi:prepilin-type N-terminal cleavage/methylation domain-containing protein